MKNFCIIFLSLIIISLTALGFSGVLSGGSENTPLTNTEYLRIHIRADSNDERAQAVKYAVRDKVVEYLTPLVAECQTKAEAMREMKAALTDIEEVANGVLQNKGFDYRANAALQREVFPTRVYGEYILPAGEYSALILRLGSGEGDNWWCVVYPPLCFAGDTNASVIYKSKIKEIIQRFYAK
jgi:stage II sporulation protein R